VPDILAANRVFVRFTEADDTLCGQASVTVRTQ